MSEVQILSPRPNLACAYRRLTRRSRSSLCRRINTTSNLIFLVPIQGSLDSGSLTIEAWGESSDRPRSVLPAKFEEMIHAAAGEVEHEPGQVIDGNPSGQSRFTPMSRITRGPSRSLHTSNRLRHRAIAVQSSTPSLSCTPFHAVCRKRTPHVMLYA
jgi:hypothetical protein